MNEKIRKLYEEASRAHEQAKAILAEFNGKEMPAEKAEEVDRLLDQVESMTSQAKREERVEEAKQTFEDVVDGKSIFEEKQFPEGVQVKVGDRVLTQYELDEYKAMLPFPGYMAALDAKSQVPYSAAFRIFLRKGERDIPDTFRKALQAGTAPAGGYLVQDTTLNTLLVKARDVSAMRRIANVLPPVPSGSVIVPSEESLFSDATWTTEIETGSEDTVQPFGGRRLTPRPLAKRIKVSNTFLRLPTFDVEGYVRDRMSYKFGIPEENAYINGTGVGQPLGILNTSSLPTYTTEASNAVSADDIINWVYRLPAAYAPQARILCNRAFIRKVRLMKLGSGQYIWQPGLQTGSPNQILDTPYELSDQYDDGLDTDDAWEDNSVVAVIGDWMYYWIVDALQMSIQRLVELYAETNQTGFIGRKESDGMAVLAEAFYALKVKA
jgi:HK97 family phage major capsid protein